MDIAVLRIGHRSERDKRATSHLFLTARAFCANRVLYTGQRSQKIEDSLKKVSDNWGGSFKVEYIENGVNYIRKWKEKGGDVIHLTMYGLPIQDVISQIKSSKGDKLIVVGGKKVSGVVYKLATWNVAITSQPHSEIAALSIFLHFFFEGRELSKKFQSAHLVIIPQPNGKKVLCNARDV
ncbi:MAG: tRNA (cytidine(56)-2'-O)-methyltransferase [Candidatus Bathyarchaeota archaeon]|nr:MAG: tRNA (cytidine(56)-2'-O)-methyltransferase [Candidatus Bathyarchaeota archaeon]